MRSAYAGRTQQLAKSGANVVAETFRLQINISCSLTGWCSESPAFGKLQNDVATNKSTYGALYNWHTVNTGKLCPTGWHVPTDAEWTMLTTYLGGESVASGKLKETGTSHWYNPKTGATNEVGFTALPGGWRDSYGPFTTIGYLGLWWSSTEYSYTTYAWSRYMYFEASNVDRSF